MGKSPSKQTKLKRDDFKTDGEANKRRIKNKKEKESKERLKKISRKAKETKKAKSKSPKMNRYDKDMMDYRKQIAGDKEMIHDIDLKKKKSMAKQGMSRKTKKKFESSFAPPNRKKANRKEDRQAKREKKAMQKKFDSMSPSKMSAELKYMPVVDREKSTMSAMGAHKVLKHMKGRM
tara:strand:- start:36 stop:566 length:531 start_codon:yes stop_codon:yes gene_type:complete